MVDKLIVLDIDETLFYCDYSEYIDNPDYTFMLTSGSGRSSIKRNYSTIKRPFLNQFLEYVTNNFKYGIYTAASEDYAKAHIKKLNLDPLFLLSYKNCTPKMDSNWSNYYSLKKLSKLSKYSSLSKMIAIDDKSESYTQNYGNLIKVNPFMGDLKDTTLMKLISYIDKIKDVNDIRSIEKRGWMNNC